MTLLATLLLISGCKEEALLNGLNQNQANEVVALLQKNNIEARKRNIAKSGYSVYVGLRDFSAAVDLTTIYDLPSKPRVEIAEMFPSDALISSPRAEVARIYSAIEQRLEQTLNQISGVVSSRVHVSYDISNTDAEKKGKPMHLAVLLRYDTANNAPANLIADATRLLKNSFSNVDYDNISVVMTPAPDAYQLPPVQTKKDNVQFKMVGLFLGVILTMFIIVYILDKNGLVRKIKINKKV
ncbi:type III secretion system inner membrane ring lipoprotein SctJ [Winslowiella toletana]|uniref:type III secretion system inner membrane ring lipoprotein SctJ n=1 Tax=Winslowiella toletana TaxID=92490 RepID=UPI0028BF0223|nr:type III secretion inner membrane ring lipoprotein SctJ [Winslowiella toletana]WNN44519.1 type III secretion inner membrane ring lipoprotein SctJ [Winslowiella toletana]